MIMFEDLLLTNHAKKKLAILTYLNENTNQPINISKIAEHLGLSYHGIAPLIEEMQQEFSTLYQISLCEKGFKVRSLKEPLSHTRYQKYLLHESLAFQLLLASILKPEMTIKEFSTVHFVSHSTITRALKPLKTYLTEKDIHLNVSQLKLTGNEINIRSFYVQILTFLDNPPFESDDLAEFSEQNQLIQDLSLQKFSPVNRRMILAILFVSKLRFLQGYSLNSFTGFEELFSSMNLPLENYFKTFMTDEKQIDYQINYFKGMLFFLVRFTDPTSERAALLCDFYEQIKQDDPIFHEFMADFSQVLLSEILGIPFDEEAFSEIQKNSFIILYLCYATNGQMIDFWAQNHLNQTFQQKGFANLQKLVRPFVTKYARRVGFEWLKNAKPLIMDYLTFFIYPYYQKGHLQKLQVGILPSLNLSAIQQISFLLDQVQFVEYAVVRDRETTFDYYIVPANRLSPTTENPAYFMEETENLQQLTPLFDALWAQYLAINDLCFH
jgi:AraC-like DNA-binding protein